MSEEAKKAEKRKLRGVWHAMRDRCSNIRNCSWKWYGGKGIQVCERWQTFENFLADMGERPKGTSIDRIDSNGNYEPSNCRWATPKQQIQNSSRFLDITGSTYGWLTVMNRSHQDSHGRQFWHCQCVCGGPAVVGGAQLRSGDTSSCGCLQYELSARTKSQAIDKRLSSYERVYGF